MIERITLKNFLIVILRREATEGSFQQSHQPPLASVIVVLKGKPESFPFWCPCWLVLGKLPSKGDGMESILILALMGQKLLEIIVTPLF